LHPRQQVPLSIERKQHVFKRSQAQKSPLPASPPFQHSQPPSLYCITKPLMNQGITGLHDLTSANEKYIFSGKQLKKHIIALNRLAAIANVTGTQDISPTSIAQKLQKSNPEQSTLLHYRKINNSTFTGLRDTHINTSAYEEVPPNPANTSTQQTVPIYTTPVPHPPSVTHYRHPFTYSFIRGPPPTHTVNC